MADDGNGQSALDAASAALREALNGDEQARQALSEARQRAADKENEYRDYEKGGIGGTRAAHLRRLSNEWDAARSLVQQREREAEAAFTKVRSGWAEVEALAAAGGKERGTGSGAADIPEELAELAKPDQIVGWALDDTWVGSSRLQRVADALFAEVPVRERIFASALCWKNAVLYEQKVFAVTTKICADVLSKAVQVRGDRIAARACDLNQELQLAPLATTLPFASNLRDQVKASFHQYVRALCDLTTHVAGAEGAIVLDLNYERVFAYQDSKRELQLVASDLGAGPATWMAEQAAKTAQSAVEVLTHGEVLHAYAAYDVPDLFETILGTTVDYNAVAELLTAADTLFRHAADTVGGGRDKHSGGEQGAAGSGTGSGGETGATGHTGTDDQAAGGSVPQDSDDFRGKEGVDQDDHTASEMRWEGLPPPQVLRSALQFAAAHLRIYGPPSLLGPPAFTTSETQQQPQQTMATLPVSPSLRLTRANLSAAGYDRRMPMVFAANN
jgi:hypothetical protein